MADTRTHWLPACISAWHTTTLSFGKRLNTMQRAHAHKLLRSSLLSYQDTACAGHVHWVAWLVLYSFLHKLRRAMVKGMHAWLKYHDQLTPSLVHGGKDRTSQRPSAGQHQHLSVPLHELP